MYIHDKIGDRNHGYLISIDKKFIEFNIARIYYIYNVPKNTTRGYHAHKNLKQILFCPIGQIVFSLDDGVDKTTIVLDSPEKTLFIGPGIWREIRWASKKSVLVVLASEPFEENDYIRNYEEYIKLVQEGYWSDNDENSI